MTTPDTPPIPDRTHNMGSTTQHPKAQQNPSEHAEQREQPEPLQQQLQQLHHLLQQIEQVETEKRFLNDATHQLRTPLAGIISQAELALQETDPQQLHRRIRKIHSAALRSVQLVRQMLSLARSEAQASSNNPADRYDIAQLAREVAREWIPKSITLQKDLGYEGLESAFVCGNRFMMREAISNLIDNALTYTPPHGIITVSVARTATQANTPATLTLQVADNGPGVADDQLPNVFQRFWRADDQTTHGSGLGLPLVARVASQHGGTASAHNAHPHGFIVRLGLPEALSLAREDQDKSGKLIA